MQSTSSPSHNENSLPLRLAALEAENAALKKKLAEMDSAGQRNARIANTVRIMSDNIPDLLWAKDMQKRYIFVNRAMCDVLLQAKDTEEPIGKTDMFFAERERAAHPENPEWHTFGEICADSDTVVMKNKRPQRFDEFGKVRGRYLHLDVHKAPLFNQDGEMVGTVGVARDVTCEIKIHMQADILQEVILALVSHTKVDDILKEILNQAKRLVQFTGANIALIDEGVFKVVYAVGYEKYNCQEFVGNLSYDVSISPINFTPLQTKEPMVIPAVADEPRWIVFEETKWIQSYLGIPFVLRGKVLGMLQFDSDTPNAFSAADGERLQPLATAASIAIDHARLLAQAQKRAEQLALAHSVGGQINKLTALDDLLQTTVDTIQRVLQYDVVQIGVFDAEANTVTLTCRALIHSDNDGKLVLDVSQGIVGRAIRERKTQVVNNVHQDPDYVSCIPESRSEIAIPIVSTDSIFGVLEIESFQHNAFDASDVVTLELLAWQVGTMIDNTRLYQQTIEDAQTKTVLLQEVNHRVKNNLASIISLLYLEKHRLKQRGEETTIEQSLTDLINAIQGLAAAHEMLSAAEWQPVSLSRLARQVISSVVKLLPDSGQITISVGSSPALINPQQANHLALVINELTTNALKYALSTGEATTFAVDIAQNETDITITFKDDGPGYPPEFLAGGRAGIGLELVNNLVKTSLAGKIAFANNGGATVTVTIPRKDSASSTVF